MFWCVLNMLWRRLSHVLYKVVYSVCLFPLAIVGLRLRQELETSHPCDHWRGSKSSIKASSVTQPYSVLAAENFWSPQVCRSTWCPRPNQSHDCSLTVVPRELGSLVSIFSCLVQQAICSVGCIQQHGSGFCCVWVEICTWSLLLLLRGAIGVKGWSSVRFLDQKPGGFTPYTCALWSSNSLAVFLN